MLISPPFPLPPLLPFGLPLFPLRPLRPVAGCWPERPLPFSLRPFSLRSRKALKRASAALASERRLLPLTILAIGLYGEELPAQNGAPLRLVCPWKYGFKGCKSIVRIALVADQPPTTWNIANPPAYGFYSNVNPAINHPWSQASERRLPDFVPRPTLLFNGYAAQVASLYSGMDLTQYY